MRFLNTLLLFTFTLPLFFTSQSNLLFAQNNFLDLTFNTSGSGYFPPAGNRKEFFDNIVLNDGSIVLAGTDEPEAWNFDFVAIKVTPAGALDASFGDNGISVINFETGDSDDRCRAISLLPDGKILLAGYLSSTSNNTIMARLEADGSLDTSFGNGGKLIKEHTFPPITGFITTNDIALLPDERFYLAGTNAHSNVMLNLYNADGTLDTSFGDMGYGIIDVSAGIDEEEVQIVVQDDGKIIVVGRIDNNNFAVRYNETGQPDSSYGLNGIAWVSMDYSASSGELASAALQSSGKLIMAGTQETGTFFTHQMMSARLTMDGKIDSTYGNNGYSILPAQGPTNASWKGGEAHSILIDENDNIFLGGKIKNGNWWRFGIMGFLSDGEINTTFADNGFAYTSGSENKIIAMTWDGAKIVAAGSFYVARFLTKDITAIEQTPHIEIAHSFSLKQNYPNPFNPETTIAYSISKPSNVSLIIYDVLGKKVKEYLPAKQNSGTYSIRFTGVNLPSGTYFYKLSVGSFSKVRRMLLLK